MKLATRTVEKVWGCRQLPAPFRNPGEEPVGEIWFEPPSSFDRVLVKYLFTSEKLSVQVHPADAQAGAGKDECWLVLAAEPGARLAIGFREAISAAAMRAAALDGSIEDLLVWHEAKPGDFFYLPAGTVHAIGPGLTLVEVQQNTDITYRLYDYGRPRELHLDQAVAVAKGAAYPGNLRGHIARAESGTLVDGPYFRFSQSLGEPGEDIRGCHSGPLLVLPLDEALPVEGDMVAAGECALARSIDDVQFVSGARALLVSDILSE